MLQEVSSAGPIVTHHFNRVIATTKIYKVVASYGANDTSFDLILDYFWLLIITLLRTLIQGGYAPLALLFFFCH